MNLFRASWRTRPVLGRNHQPPFIEGRKKKIKMRLFFPPLGWSFRNPLTGGPGTFSLSTFLTLWRYTCWNVSTTGVKLIDSLSPIFFSFCLFFSFSVSFRRDILSPPFLLHPFPSFLLFLPYLLLIWKMSPKRVKALHFSNRLGAREVAVEVGRRRSLTDGRKCSSFQFAWNCSLGSWMRWRCCAASSKMQWLLYFLLTLKLHYI